MADTPTSDEVGPLPRPWPKLTLVFVAVVAVGLLVGWIIRSQPVGSATIGRPAPNFTVDLIGESGKFRLSEHLESATGPLVLNIWASWCVPCRTEMPDLDEFARDNPDVTVLGVASSFEDILEDATEFAGEIRVSYPLAFGNRDFGNAFPKIGLPATYIIDADGVVTGLRNGIVNVADLEELVGG